MMKVENRPRNLNEDDFIMRIQNGYRLKIRYKYERGKKAFYLNYTTCRDKSDKRDYYWLNIEEGDYEDSYQDHPDIRDERHEFSTPKELLNFLKKVENFKLEDWGWN